MQLKNSKCLTISVIFMLVLIIIPISTSSLSTSDASDECYGFIVSIVKLENESFANDINCRIHHMVNDFLREQITVYWTAENCTASIIKINSSVEETMFFEKGTFVIPFTENNTIDTKIIAIICDYNQSSEIEEDVASITVYQLMESLGIKAHKLSEVKIARYVGCKTHNTQFYLFVAMQCGFLDFDITPAEEIKEKLTNDNFNIIIWPGMEMQKDGVYSYHIETQIEEIKYRVMPTIRKFIANGGGYVGSCYGAVKSANLYFANKKLILPSLRIAGIIATTVEDEPDNYLICKQKIVNNSHPVTYGLDPLVNDFFSAFKIYITGKNAQAIAVYQNSIDSLNNSPSWISNKYKNGKVVAFPSHPEIMAFLEEEFSGRHVVSNTWFHLTNKGIFDTKFENVVNLTFIGSVFENTSNLVDNSVEPTMLFDDVRNKINLSIYKMNDLKSKLLDVRSLVEELDASESVINNMNKTIRRTLGGKNISGGINLSNYYFEIIPEILGRIEKIYPLLENEPNFTEEVQSFIETMLSKISLIEDLTLKAKEDAEKAENAIKKYQNNKWVLPKIKEFYINEMLFRVREKISEVFVRISQTYHETLKFLRHNWYDYEMNVI